MKGLRTVQPVGWVVVRIRAERVAEGTGIYVRGRWGTELGAERAGVG